MSNEKPDYSNIAMLVRSHLASPDYIRWKLEDGAIEYVPNYNCLWEARYSVTYFTQPREQILLPEQVLATGNDRAFIGWARFISNPFCLDVRTQEFLDAARQRLTAAAQHVYINNLYRPIVEMAPVFYLSDL